MEEIGCIGTEQDKDVQEVTEYQSDPIEKQAANLTENELKLIILSSKQLITLFKGDL